MKTHFLPRILILVLFLFLLPLRAAEATQQVMMESKAQSTITYTTAYNFPPNVGFLPVRVKIENRATEERRWTLDFSINQQTYAPRRLYSSLVLREQFTVAASSTLEKVVFVPAPAQGTGGTNYFSVAATGPDVRNSTTGVSFSQSGPAQATQIAVSPSLENAIQGLRNSNDRKVVYPARDGSLQNRFIPPESSCFFTMSNGCNVVVPSKGTPTVTQGAGGDIVAVSVSPAGDVTITAPAGVFVVTQQTRFTNAQPSTANLPPPHIAKVVFLEGPNTAQRKHYIFRGSTGTFRFSDSTVLEIPFDAAPKITSTGSNPITFTIGSDDRVTVKMPANVRMSGMNMTGGPANLSGQLRGASTALAPIISTTINTSTCDFSRWPADPRMWSLFSAVVIEMPEWEKMDEPHKVALRDWVALGGILLLSPENTSSSKTTELHGAGKIITLEKSVRDYTTDNLKALSIRDPLRRTRPWSSFTELLSKEDFAAMDIVQKGKIAFVFLLLFGIIAGPVAYFKLAPSGKRHRLFVIVPALSLGTTLFLGIFILVREGLGGKGIRRSLVLLLPDDKKAAVFQQQVVRSGLILNTSFTIPAETYLSRFFDPADPGSGNDNLLLIREGDTALGAWFESRTSQSHYLNTILPTRSRIEIVKYTTDLAPVIRSNIPTKLSFLLYVDESGKKWTAMDIAPGALINLESDGKIPGAAKYLNTNPTPDKGWFYAIGDAGELAPIDTLKTIQWTQDSVMYAGKLTELSKEESK